MSWQNAPVVWAPEQQQRQPGAWSWVNQGIAQGVGGLVDLVNTAISPVTKPLGLYTDKPIGGSRSLASGMEAIGIDVAPPGADPQGYGARAAQGVGLAAGMLIPGAGAVGAASRAASPVARGVAGEVARPFISTPGRALAIEAGAGAGAGAGGLYGERKAEEAGINPAYGRVAGEMLGGLGAAAGPGLAARGVGRAIEATPLTGTLVRAGRAALLPFTEAGARARASNRLRDLAGDPAAAAAAVDEPSIGGLTPAQKTGDTRLMALERAILDKDSTLDKQFAERSAEGAQTLREALREPAGDAAPQDAQAFIQARRAYLQGLLEQRVAQAEEAAQAAVAKLAPGMKETEASAIVRRELDAALRDARAQERELWSAVPQDVRVPTGNAREAFQTFRAQLGRAQQDDIPEEAVRFLDPDRNSAFTAEESVREMHALYSRLRETARTARAAGNANKARIADGIADAVLRDLGGGQDVGAPLDAARAFSRQLNQTFRQGRIGDILGVEREGGLSTPPELTLGQTIGQGGAKGAVAADELRAAVKGSADAEAAMRDYMRRRFSEFASPRGEFRPERAQDFLRQNAELLDRFPELKREIAEAAESGQFAGEARRVVDEGLKDAQKTPGAEFAEAPYQREFDAVLKARDPRQAARAVAREAALDQTGKATRGLKAAALDYLIRSGGGETLSGAKLRQALGDARVRGALGEILDNQEIARLGRIAQELDKQAQAAGRLPDVGGVMNDPVNTIISFLGRTLGARHGAMLGRGTSGASLLTANFASRRVQQILESLTNDRAEQLLRDAIQDPELFKALLIPADTSRRAAQVERRLVEWLGAEAGQAGEETRGREPAKPETAAPWKDAPVIWQPGGAGAGPRSESGGVIRQTARAMAERFKVPPDLFERLVTQESAWKPDAKSGKGARGLTQVMPATASKPGFGVQPLKYPNDVREQLRFGAQYLSAMLRRYGGDAKRALVAYNWGPGNADKWNGDLAALPAETREFVRKIAG